jgi:hypothetical protein
MSFCIALTDADWSLTKDLFSIVGTVASACGVGLAFYIGLQGLATWKRQLRGTTDHELARKALIELYKYQEAIVRARSPIMFGPKELEPEEQKGLSFTVRSYLRRCRYYSELFAAIHESRAPIAATLLESQALWSEELGKLFKPLFTLQHEFYLYVEYWLMASDPREDDDYRQTYFEVIKDKPKIIYDKLDEVGDDFRQAFSKGVSDIEAYLRPKLA